MEIDHADDKVDASGRKTLLVFALAAVIFGIAGLSALWLLVIAGLSALWSLLTVGLSALWSLVTAWCAPK